MYGVWTASPKRCWTTNTTINTVSFLIYIFIYIISFFFTYENNKLSPTWIGFITKLAETSSAQTLQR